MRRNKSFFAALFLAATLGMSSCTMLPNAFQKSNNDAASQEASESKQESSQIKIPEAYQIYQLYLGTGGTLTYEEWLESVRGKDGKDGHSPVVTIGANGHWFIDGNDTGINAQGEKGDKGDEGAKGDTGDKGETGEKGDTGKSAYEQYKEAHPEYNKSEEEWLDDLLNGRLAIQTTHTVSFNTNGGTEVADQTVVHGEKASKPNNPTKVGYTFEGWEYNGEPWSFYGYVVTSDMVIEAVWKAIDYTATFLNEDGTVLELQENVHYGESLSYQGEVPVKPNPEDHYVYTFTGWDKALSVDGDMVFTAQYSKEYAPYEERYIDYDNTVLLSRFMTAEMNSNKAAKVTWNGQTMSLGDGARFEAEDGVFNSIEKYYTDVCSGGCFIGCFQDNRTATYTFDCDSAAEVDMTFSVARDSDAMPLSDFWTIKVNGVTIDLSELTGPRTDGWESFVTIPGPHISLKQGSNTIYIRANQALNVDYFELSNGASSDISSLIETPTKPTEGNVKYMFHGWDLVSEENDVITYQAHYEACTNGLEFVNNKVDVYHGASKDVVVPAWWDGFRITEIGRSSFAGTNVKSVLLPNSITTIADHAFEDCKQLETINFPNSLTLIKNEAFTRDTALEHVTFNEGLQRMEYRAFEGAGLKEVILPSTLTYIGDNALGGLYADFIYVPATVINIDWHCFYSPDGRTNQVFCEREYRPSTFDTNWALRCDVTWGYKGLIEDNGYKYAITEIEGVTGLRFVGVDSSVTDFVLPESVNNIPITSISTGAFTGNKTLKTVVLPDIVTEIPERMFYQCDHLEQITIPETVTTIGRYAFANCGRLQSFVMPNSVTEAGDHCFENCENMASITLSTGLKVIREGLFKNCDALVHIEIPEGVETTEFGIVELADNVRSITFPSTLKSLGNQTFFYNWGIDYLYLKCSPETWNTILETYNNDYDGIDRPAVLYYSEEAPTQAGDYWHYVNGVPTEW